MGSTFVLHGGRRRGGVEVGGGEADLRLAGPLPRRSPFPAGFEGDHGDHVRPDHDGPLQKFCEFLWCSHSNLLCRSFRDLHFKRKMLPSVAFFEYARSDRLEAKSDHLYFCLGAFSVTL
ncbi:uncharacterized protein LOC124695455 [Lolium rigidum]|uniref:uncharacterized protein LOC124695455 n=1 Tax=Lolium rigidum TaxID=89674 RepID=UPI001F5C13E9|nr:uncharacterized protein LOC124695455 [Lolium rigidum]